MSAKSKKKGHRFLDILTSGEFLLSLKVDKYFIHIIYTFLLILGALLLGYSIQGSFVQAENNKAAIEELRIKHAELTYQLEQQHRMTKILEELHAEGSEVSLPTEPPVIIR